MGSQAALTEVPRFRVRAVGAFRQKPGCAEHSISALSPARLHHLCRGECYNPSDERKAITRIEVVRIRPQMGRDEAVADLIEDPWRVLHCDADASGCSVEFEDSEYPTRAATRSTTFAQSGALGIPTDGSDRASTTCCSRVRSDFRASPSP